MNIEIEWHAPTKLTKSKNIILDRDKIPSEIPDCFGVYYFSRRFGENFTPFYIGETKSIRSRLRQHLKDANICRVLEGSASALVDVGQGARYFHYGVLNYKSHQDPKKCVQLVERLMIRQAVEDGLLILNHKSTKIRTNTINFIGNKEGRGWYKREYKPETRD